MKPYLSTLIKLVLCFLVMKNSPFAASASEEVTPEQWQANWVKLNEDHPIVGPFKIVTKMESVEGKKVMYTIACYEAKDNTLILAMLVQNRKDPRNTGIKELFMLAGTPLIIRELGDGKGTMEGRVDAMMGLLDLDTPPFALFRVDAKALRKIYVEATLPLPAPAPARLKPKPKGS